MSPLETIIAAVQKADHERPYLKAKNTFASCGELLELTRVFAGPEWAFIGKSTSTGMDGAGFQPAWFSPRHVDCTRPDGQSQRVLIDALSQDALWHVPTLTQYKVIANSTANELPPDDPRRGAAHLTPYEITPHSNYRWHNPPIAASGQAQPEPTPMPTPQVPGYEDLGGDEGAKKITRILEHDYKAAKRPGLDGECGGWLRRTDYDFIVGICKSVEESILKHRDEWLRALGLTEPLQPGMMSDGDKCLICGADVSYERGKRRSIAHAADCTTR